MLWSDFQPYVLPYVIGCPSPVIDHHIRLAAIEFCRRTSCWQKTLDPINTNGADNLVELEPDTNTQIVKIKAVEVGGVSWPLVDSATGLALIRSNSQQSFCFTQDNKTLQIQPLQVSGIAVVVDVVAAPKTSAMSMDDLVANDYLNDIAMGAVASLLRIPKQEWTDPVSAQSYSQQFNNRIGTVASKAARGFMAQKMRSHASYL